MSTEARRLTLDEFMKTTRPVWIQHTRHRAYNNWVVFDRKMLAGDLVRIEMIKAGALLMSASSYGGEWVAYSDRPML